MKYVLIVDDDLWLAETMARQLSRAKIDSKIVGDGLAAMTEIDNDMPAAIVLDVFMPGPNGIVLLQELQSYDDLATIPVILCTTSASDLNAQDLAPYGVCEVLDKVTITPNSVVTAVKKVIE